MNAINVNPRAMIARVGAALAAFVLAFSLLGVTSPAHADSFKVWLGMKFSGENVAISLKMHAPSEYGSTKTICDAMKKSATKSSDGKVTKSGIEQYKGVEVCVIEAEGKLNEDNSSSAFGFSIKRDGDKLTIKSTSSNRFASVGDIEYRFTFDDGVVSSSGGKVEGNTFVTTDTKFEVVGKPGGTSKILMYALIGALIGGGTGLGVFLATRSKKKAQPQQFASPYAAQPGQYPQGQAAPGAPQPGVQQPGVPQQPQPNPQQPYNPNAQGGQGV